MARDFHLNSLEIRCLAGNSLCSGVLSCALECSPVLETLWRRACWHQKLPRPPSLLPRGAQDGGRRRPPSSAAGEAPQEGAPGAGSHALEAELSSPPCG